MTSYFSPSSFAPLVPTGGTPTEGRLSSGCDFSKPMSARRQTPCQRQVIAVTGARESDDARRIGRIEALGWEVLVIDYRALSQERWAATVERVAAFLEEGRGRWPAPTRVEARTPGVQVESD